MGQGGLLGWVLKRGGEGSGRRALFCGMEAEEKDKDSKVGKVKKKKDPIPPPKKRGGGRGLRGPAAKKYRSWTFRGEKKSFSFSGEISELSSASFSSFSLAENT